MDRRRFAHLSGISLAALRLRAFAQVKSDANPGVVARRVGIAAVGLESIAEVFMSAVGRRRTPS